jgi:release factor glutamine methyltransferase
MSSKKYWEKLTLDFVSDLKKIRTKKRIKILGYSFLSLPGVFSPSCSSDTPIFAKWILPYIKHVKFLEIGTGTGIIACIAALKGASKVIATDINPKAVKNTRLNQKLLGLDFSVRKGDLLKPIKRHEMFDIIFWNHPFNYTKETSLKKTMLDLSVFDYKYQSLQNFFKQSKKHLKKDGKILLGSSNMARIRLIEQLAKSEGYKLSLLHKETIPVSKNQPVKMDVRLYALKIN